MRLWVKRSEEGREGGGWEFMDERLDVGAGEVGVEEERIFVFRRFVQLT